jgi:hypothetical protein
MNRMVGAAAVGLFTVAVAQGHFPFVVPEPDGTRAKVVFSDDLNPDTAVNIEKLANTKLFLRDASGKETPLTWTKGEGHYLVELPGSGPRVVYGVSEYGVLQKGDAKPFRLTYYPKALVGAVPEKVATIGDKVNLEILTEGGPGKTRFQVMSRGKPVPEAEVTVLLPGSGKQAVKTDKEGFTPAFQAAGRYGVSARLTETRSGEHEGKKFEEVRHYATLVVDVGGK